MDFNLDDEMAHKLASMLGNNVGGEKSKGKKPTPLDFDNFDFGNIDFDTIMKAQSLLKKLNDKKGDNRSRLLNSLKPYMRDSRKEEIDKYSKMLRMADLMEFLNIENNKGDKNNKV